VSPGAARARMALVMFVAVLVQTALGDDLRVLGVAPDLMVLVAICGGMFGGPEAGAWVGFWAGLVADLFLVSTPLGLSALTYCLIGFAVGALRSSVLPEGWLLTPVLALVATAAAVVLFVGAGDVVGEHQLIAAGRTWLVKVAVVEGLCNAVLALPVAWLYRRAARGSKGMERMGGARADRLSVG